MRVEQCACGGYIQAESLKASAPIVLCHNQTAVHERWRALVFRRELADIERLDIAGEALPLDPRRERPTASQASASGSTGSVRGSASGTAGASAAAAEGRSLR